MTVSPRLMDVLDLERIDDDLYRGHSPNKSWRRVFGGLVIAQALVAASRTVQARPPHSLHAYFILGGDPHAPIDYRVERIRDGRSFSTRRCSAIQHGDIIFTLAASFHVAEDGFDHAIAPPPTPGPEGLLDFSRLRESPNITLPPFIFEFLRREVSIEFRPVDAARYTPLGQGETREPQQRVWFRVTDPLPDDPTLHCAALAYMSDMTLLDSSLAAHGASVFDGTIDPASLDHSIWFHRPFRVDEWLLYVQDSPSAYGGRGLARGSIFARDGMLIASVAQEGLIRRRRPKSHAQ